MKQLLLPSLLASALILQISPAWAINSDVATATIDWSTFSYQVIDLSTFANITSNLTWSYQSSQSDASTVNPINSYSADWSTPLSNTDGVASSKVDANILQATFSTAPTTANANADARRYGSFTLPANSIAIFSVDGSSYINMDNSNSSYSYASTSLSVDRYNNNNSPSQNSYSDATSYAAGIGNPVSSSGKLLVSLVNPSSSDMSGEIHGDTRVSMYSYVSGVPEPEPTSCCSLGWLR